MQSNLVRILNFYSSMHVRKRKKLIEKQQIQQTAKNQSNSIAYYYISRAFFNFFLKSNFFQFQGTWYLITLSTIVFFLRLRNKRKTYFLTMFSFCFDNIITRQKNIETENVLRLQKINSIWEMFKTDTHMSDRIII